LQREFAKPLHTLPFSLNFAFYRLRQFVMVGSHKALLADEGYAAKMVISRFRYPPK
jgi:hypothetical protein